MTHVELQLANGGRLIVRRMDVLQVTPNGKDSATVQLLLPGNTTPTLLTVTQSYEALRQILGAADAFDL